MNREEIEERIRVCETRAMEYREADKARIADRYDREKWKWEELLSDLDLLNEKKIKELLGYKKAYYRQREIADNFVEELDKNKLLLNNPIIFDFYLKMKGISE